jgi:rieske iron-sulfur protein
LQPVKILLAYNLPQKLVRDFDMKPWINGTIGRRSLLKGTIPICIGVFAPELAFGQDDPRSSRPKEGDMFVKTTDSRMTPLTAEDLTVGAGQTIAWPFDPVEKILRNGSRLNQVLLLKLEQEKLSPETKLRSADGVVAYTAICTHSGCEVDAWLSDEQLLYCPCHDSKFDPRDGAKVVDGPAPRVLAALALGISGGRLIVTKPYTSRVGFESE